MSLIVAESSEQYPYRFVRLTSYASSHIRSFAEQSLDLAGTQYVSLAMTVARNTSRNELVGSPWLQRTRIA